VLASGKEEFSTDELTVISDKTRGKLAEQGKALPDGSYPIRNVSDLKNAIHSYGRSKESERETVKNHIIKRARELGRADLIPAGWAPSPDLADEEFGDESGKSFAAEVKDQGVDAKYTPETQPRDENGKFRDVIARLDEAFDGGAPKDVADKIAETKAANEAGRLEDAKKAGDELLQLVDRIDAKALNPKALENVKDAAGELGKVIANLPLNFGNQADKVRFSDLPQSMQDLVKDMIKRVGDKIGQKDADVATQSLRDFMAGGDLYSQSEISSEMSKLLRLLT
jgi:hypothetical protein